MVTACTAGFAIAESALGGDYDGAMRRIRQGWELTGKSWRLLRSNRVLLRFPVYAALAALAVLVVAILPGLYLIDAGGEPVIGAVVTAIGVYLGAFVGIFFGVALAAAADEVFHGRPATIGDGIRVARSRFGAIAGWAAVSAIVGAALAALQNVRGAGAIIGALIGTAWSLITFLAVPVIALEGTGPLSTLKRSASIFKQRWGAQVTGNVAIGGIVLLAGVLPAIGLIALGVVIWAAGSEAEIAAGAVIVAVGAAVLLVSMVVLRAMHGVFGVALYRFAREGEAIADFTAAELEAAVRAR